MKLPHCCAKLLPLHVGQVSLEAILPFHEWIQDDSIPFEFCVELPVSGGERGNDLLDTKLTEVAWDANGCLVEFPVPQFQEENFFVLGYNTIYSGILISPQREKSDYLHTQSKFVLQGVEDFLLLDFGFFQHRFASSDYGRKICFPNCGDELTVISPSSKLCHKVKTSCTNELHPKRLTQPSEGGSVKKLKHIAFVSSLYLKYRMGFTIRGGT